MKRYHQLTRVWQRMASVVEWHNRTIEGAEFEPYSVNDVEISGMTDAVDINATRSMSLRIK